MLSKNKKLFHTLKTQVTAFIIVGILIIAIVWSAAYISEYFSEKDMEKFAPVGHQLTLESDTIKENIDTCVQSLTDKGIQLMSDQGLYLEIPENYTYNNHAYWLKNTINIMPSSFEKIEQDLTSYINTNLLTCANLDEFKENGWDISPFIPATTAKIHEEDIGVEVEYTINVKKQDFERQFSNSIYNPKIRFRQMYGKSVDFINTQLLRPDFDFNNPLEGYDLTGYTIAYEKPDNQTLLFSIIDTQSKVLNGKPFTLKFAADFSINNIPRTYDVSNSHETRVLYSPDRLAVLILPPDVVSSSDRVTIGPYERDSVIRKNTPTEKIGKTVTKTKDITFNTAYPIYRFSPTGTTFNEPALLRIYLNKDQRQILDNFTLLYYGKNGWLPYPNLINSSDGFIDTLIYGFSKYAGANSNTMPTQTYSGPKTEAERSFWETWGPTIILVIAILITIYTLNPPGPTILPGGEVELGLEVLGDGPAVIDFTAGVGVEGIPVSPTIGFAGPGGPGLAEVIPATLDKPAHFVIPASSTLTSIPTGLELTLASGTATAAPTIGSLSGLANILSKIPVLGTTLGFIAPANIAALGSRSASSYLAYNLWNGVADTEDTFVIVAVNDGEIHIAPNEDDGDCKCFIQNIPEGDIEPVSGTYNVTRANTYTVTAAVTDFDYGHDEATCQCEITGLVITASSDPPSKECTNDLDCDDYEFCNNNKECEEKEIEEQLVCCTTYDGFCLDNYLNSLCNGNGVEKTCIEITECLNSAQLSRKKHLKITSLTGDSSGFGREGDTLLLSSYLPDTTEDTTVKAYIKKDGTRIDSITLYDDGAHNDDIIHDKYYANTWDSGNILGNSYSTEITGDIEIIDSSGNTETIQNTGSIVIIDTNTGCEPIGILSSDNSLDIIFIDESSQYAESTAAKILSTNQFIQYYINQGINFYKKTNINDNCGNAPKKLIIEFNNERCTQNNNIVKLNPLFAFKSNKLSNTDVDTVLNDFCSYIKDLSLLNPPVATITTGNMEIVSGHVNFEFQITDEEYPVNYEVLLNGARLEEEFQVTENIIYTHTLNLIHNGNWRIQIKAKDKQGMTGYSNVLSILVDNNNGGEIE